MPNFILRSFANLALVLSMTGLLVAPTVAIPAQGEFAKVGEGEFRWLRFRVYTAQLWAPGGTFQADEPATLRIRYARDLTADRLLQGTARAWQRLRPASAVQREDWLRELRALWPDVANGDELAVLVEPGGASTFFRDGEVLGTVQDPDFGPAFLDIWLSPRSPSGGLSQALLGQGQ